MGDPSAILAINSLDRYITTVLTTTTYLQARWIIANPFQMAVDSGTPVVGAVLTFSSGSGFPVIPPTILAVTGPVGNYQITINQPVTANQAVAAFTIQEVSKSNANQPVSNSLISQYEKKTPYSNNFTIQSPGALIYGYINKIIVSQIQLSYNIPTVNEGLNDRFYIGTLFGAIERFVIPHGFYYADQLAAAMKILILANPILASYLIDVVFSPRDGFIFTSKSVPPKDFYFASPALLRTSIQGPNALNQRDIDNVLKTYRLLGMTNLNNEILGQNTEQKSTNYPNFLYTPYIDFYSDVLTNYQLIKDTNTSIEKPKGLVARVYVSGAGNVQVTGSTSALGTAPFVMTSDLNSPKVIRWNPDVAVPSIDFRLLDCYGDLIPGPPQGHSTEFEMTLLCVESS